MLKYLQLIFMSLNRSIVYILGTKILFFCQIAIFLVNFFVIILENLYVVHNERIRKGIFLYWFSC